MCGERMAERMAARMLRDIGGAHGASHSALHHRSMVMWFALKFPFTGSAVRNCETPEWRPCPPDRACRERRCSASAVVSGADRAAHAIEQAGTARIGGRCLVYRKHG